MRISSLTFLTMFKCAEKWFLRLLLLSEANIVGGTLNRDSQVKTVNYHPMLKIKELSRFVAHVEIEKL